MADKKDAKTKKKKPTKKEQEKLAKEEAEKLAKEKEEKEKAEEEAKKKAEEEERLKKEEEEKKKEEERLRKEEEERQKLAEKIELVPDEDEETEVQMEKPEDKLYHYNGKEIRPKLVKSDITENIKNRAFELGFEALSKFTAEKEMAEYIKKKFDNEFEPEWQIVIGKDFSVAFSFEIENFIFFQIEDYYLLYYKL